MNTAQKDPFSIDGQKAHLHPGRIAQWLQAKTVEDKLKVYPIYVEISPVGHCNHRCTFCAVDYIGYQTRRIETEVLNRALSDMASGGVKSVMFAGEGEPMLHPDIAELTINAHAAGLDVAFTTNGTALTKKFVDQALHAVKWIKVSMNGGEKTYAKIHQTRETDYERVWSQIQFAVEQRNGRGLQTVIGIQCLVLPDNIDELECLCRRAWETGLGYIVFKPYSQHKSSVTQTYAGLTYHKYNELLTSLVEKYSKPAFKVIHRTQAMEGWDAGVHKYEKCHATPYLWAYIMATGDVYSCSAYLLNEEFKLGNINQEPFQGLWEGPRRAKHIEAMETLDISKCRVNCRMNQVNRYLDELANPNPHVNFI